MWLPYSIAFFFFLRSFFLYVKKNELLISNLKYKEFGSSQKQQKKQKNEKTTTLVKYIRELGSQNKWMKILKIEYIG